MEQTRVKTAKPSAPGFRARAVRWAVDHREAHPSEAAAVTAIVARMGSPGSLRVWMRQTQRDGGARPDQTGAKKARSKGLERRNRALRQGEEGQKTIRAIVSPTNERLRKASAYFAHAPLAV